MSVHTYALGVHEAGGLVGLNANDSRELRLPKGEGCCITSAYDEGPLQNDWGTGNQRIRYFRPVAMYLGQSYLLPSES